MTAKVLHRKGVRLTVEEWWKDSGPFLVVMLQILGPQGGVQGSAAMEADTADSIAADLRRAADVARIKAQRGEANRVAAQLGYPPAFAEDAADTQERKG